MAVPLFAGVDNNKNFPPKIREQLAKSNELKATIVPMSESEKDNLKLDELWHGRVIYNLNKKAIETWSSDTNSWILSLNEDYEPPLPTPPWDRYYQLPEVVRNQLALSSDFKYIVVSMNYLTRDRLEPDELWDGRVIFNTTVENHQVWNNDAQIWITLLNDTYVPKKVKRNWTSWEAVMSLTNEQILDSTTRYGSGYVNQNGRVSLMLNEEIDADQFSQTGLPLRASLPLPNALPSGLDVFGRCEIIRYIPSISDHVVDHGLMFLEGNTQHVFFYYEDFYNGVLGAAVADVADQNYVWINGQLMYETA